MTKVRQVERKKSATREVTVRLHGYPAYERTLSGHHDGYWCVDLVFACGPCNRAATVFESTDYSLALIKYRAYRQIVE